MEVPIDWAVFKSGMALVAINVESAKEESCRKLYYDQCVELGVQPNDTLLEYLPSLRGSFNLKEFRVGNENYLGPRGCATITTFLLACSSSLQVVVMKNQGVDDSLLEYLIENVFGKLKRLEVLDLSDNTRITSASASRLFQLLADNQMITTFSVDGTSMGKALQRGLKKRAMANGNDAPGFSGGASSSTSGLALKSRTYSTNSLFRGDYVSLKKLFSDVDVVGSGGITLTELVEKMPSAQQKKVMELRLAPLEHETFSICDMLQYLHPLYNSLARIRQHMTSVQLEVDPLSITQSSLNTSAILGTSSSPTTNGSSSPTAPTQIGGGEVGDTASSPASGTTSPSAAGVPASPTPTSPGSSNTGDRRNTVSFNESGVIKMKPSTNSSLPARRGTMYFCPNPLSLAQVRTIDPEDIIQLNWKGLEKTLTEGRFEFNNYEVVQISCRVLTRDEWVKTMEYVLEAEWKNPHQLSPKMSRAGVLTLHKSSFEKGVARFIAADEAKAKATRQGFWGSIRITPKVTVKLWDRFFDAAFKKSRRPLHLRQDYEYLKAELPIDDPALTEPLDTCTARIDAKATLLAAFERVGLLNSDVEEGAGTGPSTTPVPKMTFAEYFTFLNEHFDAVCTPLCIR